MLKNRQGTQLPTLYKTSEQHVGCFILGPLEKQKLSFVRLRDAAFANLDGPWVGSVRKKNFYDGCNR